MFMSGVYVSNVLLVGYSRFYDVFFALQSVCYLVALFAPYLEKVGIAGRIVTFSRYFLLLNVASAHAFCKFILGKKQVIWTPRKG
jgi:hypothetical protein